MTVRDMEREFRADGGSLGRGKPMTKAEVEALDFSGYEPFTHPDGKVDFPIYGCDGSPTGAMWRGYTREENGVHYCVSVEYYNV